MPTNCGRMDRTPAGWPGGGCRTYAPVRPASAAIADADDRLALQEMATRPMLAADPGRQHGHRRRARYQRSEYAG
jgi:hypothetical protein